MAAKSFFCLNNGHLRWRRLAGLSSILLITHLALATVAAHESAATGPLLGLQAVAEPLPWFDSQPRYAAYDSATRSLAPDRTVAVTSSGRPPQEAPLQLQLSRYRYPFEDGHLDGLLRFDLPLGNTPRGTLRFSLCDEAGHEVSRATVASIPGSQLHFSYRFPAEMAGKGGALQVSWKHGRHLQGETKQQFVIAQAAPVATSGRIALTLPNPAKATFARLPLTVGIPFPNGLLSCNDNLRLLAADGTEIPLQAEITGRWSRFGSVKWVLCSFVVDLDGAPLELALEYGPDVQRTAHPDLALTRGSGFPTIDTGLLKLAANGLWHTDRDGNERQLLAPEALHGAFVEHADGAGYVGWGHRWQASRGRLYTMPKEADFTVEEQGSERVVLKTAGWYREAGSDAKFCKYLVRYHIYRNSPLVRIFHTWIYTGDSNHDTIRNMGWHFPLADLKPAGFLASADDSAAWLNGYYLRQHDHDEYALFDYAPPKQTDSTRELNHHFPARPLKERLQGGRSPGIMAATNHSHKLYIGVQDFWRNFPSSLMQEEQQLTFYQWPRYGRQRQHPIDPASHSEVWRLWFAHEGETLNLRLPRELTEAPIYVAECGPEPHYAHGRPDSVNAQGVAKTAEMWLYLRPLPEDDQIADELPALQGLHGDLFSVVVDPDWLCRSGAFYETVAVNQDDYPEYEAAYEDAVTSPLRQVERLSIYGKWLYGDLLGPGNLSTQEGGLYRTLRKSHQGWPYSWTQYVRSGNLAFRNFAQAATRMMSDIGFCHYVSDDVADFFATRLAPCLRGRP